MRKIIGIFMLACICLILGLSVRWGREADVSLASAHVNVGYAEDVLLSNAEF